MVSFSKIKLKYPRSLIIRRLKKILLLPLTFMLFFIALFLVVIIRLISPLVIIRTAWLDIGRIGGTYHADLYLSEKNCGQYKSGFFDLFYPVKITNHANQQWKKMWGREVNIIYFSGLAKSVERVNALFPGYKKYLIPNSSFMLSKKEYNKYLEIKDPAIYAKLNNHLEFILRTVEPNLSFTSEEIVIGDRSLLEMGIPEKTSFICFHNRDSAFLDSVNNDSDWSYHDFRDSNIQNYLVAVEAIILRGNYAVRMGAITKDKVQSANPKFIDYANNGMRTDFLDIYLSAKCKFILCSDTGLSFPSEVFNTTGDTRVAVSMKPNRHLA